MRRSIADLSSVTASALSTLILFAASTLLADDRKEIVIPAAELAPPEIRSDTLTPGKWWLRRTAEESQFPGGAILLSGEPSTEKLKSAFWDVIPLSRFVPYRLPELVIDPRASGWYRIHVGLYYDDFDYYSPPMLQGKLSGEKFPEFLQAPHGTQGKIGEAYWKAADLTGKKIHLIQPPGPMPHEGSGWLGGATHLRLVPMTDAEVAAAKQELELPPVDRRLFAMLDTTDEIYWYGDADNEEDVRAVVYRHGQAGFGRIYWRTYGTYLDNSLSIPEAAPRWSEKDEAAYIAREKTKAGWMPYIDLSRRFDPLKVAVEYGRTIDCDVHAMVRFTNHNRPPYSNFWHDHPEFYAQMLVSESKDPKTGQPIPKVPYERRAYQRVLSFAYPEVRTYYVKFFKQLASTGTKGIMIDMLRHPPIAGFETVVTEAFKKKYGKDMETLNIYKDPQVQEHLSEYFRLFLVEMREAIGPEIEISVRCSGPNNYALKGKEWIEAGLINTIVDGHWYSGNGIRPTIEATIAAVGTKGRAMAAAEINNVDPGQNYKPLPGVLSPAAIQALANGYSGRGVASFGLYESTLHTWAPDVRRAIRAAGWNYDPSKSAK
jgi:hypothetical protein